MPSPDTPTAAAQEGAPDLPRVIEYLHRLQDRIEVELNQLEPSRFRHDEWQHNSGGGGSSRVVEGTVIEKGGVNFSHVRGPQLPPAASTARADVAGKAFEATGVSVVIHPQNPFAPTAHLNVRFLLVDPTAAAPQWWFGGGFDLTPYYGFDEDCQHWHRVARAACQPFGAHHYARFKRCCDEYFYIKHRQEARGIGGVFFDDYTAGGFDAAFAFMRSVGDSFLPAYRPILERRMHTAYTPQHRQFQRYRRARYVEFNLVYDRGTLFGLQAGGRVESILMSLPPEAAWPYNWQAAAASDEARLVEYYLKPRNWLSQRD